ncbi:nose resistant to fluoxetine protein 6-like [Pollicipes pollicipes]|uniref:nose resistant to fluoxetine protein 6-like n=1 Tax=Pollicipes pollicipes TaxID=41117 RepID=UPI001884DF9C|nr:nose resistant to fluoxetine protein 6-like [Pollicipes pollicipes]
MGLTPVYAITVALTATLARRIGTGPGLASALNTQAKVCQDSWWKNLLYINNFTDIFSLCIGQSWYLPVDFQLFLAAPFMMLPYVYNKKIGAAWLALLAAGSVAVPAVITYQEDLPPTDLFFNINSIPKAQQFFEDFYIKPWCRASPYIVGIGMGLLLHHIKANKITIRIPAAVNVAMWALMSATGLVIVYGTHQWNKDPTATWTTAEAVSYGSLHRLAWGIALSWVVFACVNGYGGFANMLLSFKGFIPLGRLTYTTYLVAVQVQTWYFSSFKGTARYGNTIMVFTFLSNLIVSTAIAAVLSLCFESPMMSIEKIIFPQRRTKTGPSETTPKDLASAGPAPGETPHESRTRL